MSRPHRSCLQKSWHRWLTLSAPPCTPCPSAGRVSKVMQAKVLYSIVCARPVAFCVLEEGVDFQLATFRHCQVAPAAYCQRCAPTFKSVWGVYFSDAGSLLTLLRF